MRQIEIETDVFALIWANRKDGEETENEILRRVLSIMPSEKSRGSVETAKTHRTKKEKAVLWRDDIVDGLTRLGGEADLAEIYKVVRSIRKTHGRTLPPSTEAVIRRELENNSSDSESFTAQRDLFCSVNGLGGGRWALR